MFTIFMYVQYMHVHIFMYVHTCTFTIFTYIHYIMHVHHNYSFTYTTCMLTIFMYIHYTYMFTICTNLQLTNCYYEKWLCKGAISLSAIKMLKSLIKMKMFPSLVESWKGWGLQRNLRRWRMKPLCNAPSIGVLDTHHMCMSLSQ